jgi:hypothetical protein
MALMQTVFSAPLMQLKEGYWQQLCFLFLPYSLPFGLVGSIFACFEEVKGSMVVQSSQDVMWWFADAGIHFVGFCMKHPGLASSILAC